jgi:hypothetical protein
VYTKSLVIVYISIEVVIGEIFQAGFWMPVICTTYWWAAGQPEGQGAASEK